MSTEITNHRNRRVINVTPRTWRIPIFNRFTVKMKLTIASTFLVCFAMIGVYFLSEEIMSQLLQRTQMDFERSTFRQADQLVSTILEDIDRKLDTIVTSNTFKTSITTGVSLEPQAVTLRRYNQVDSAINNTFTTRNYVDSIYVIGRNNTFYNYSIQALKLYKNNTVNISRDINFDQWKKSFPLHQFNDKMNRVTYFHMDSSQASQADPEMLKLYRQMEGSLTMIRLLSFDGSSVDGVMILRMNDSLIPTILSDSSANHNIYVTTLDNELIWTNTSLDTIQSKDWTSFLKNDNLVTTETIPSLHLVMHSVVPIKSLIKNSPFSKNAIVVAGWLIVLNTVLAYYIAKTISRPIHRLARQLPTLRIGQENQIRIKAGFMSNLSLRNKFIVYFLITVQIPVMIFTVYASVAQHQFMRDHLITLTSFNNTQIKTNVDYRLHSLNEATIKLITDSDIQSVMKTQEKGLSISSDHLSNIYKLLFDIKISNDDIRMIQLFDESGTNIFSSSTFDNLPVSNLSEAIKSRLPHDDDKLKLIDLSDREGINSSDVSFVRTIRSTGEPFGKYLGYLVIIADNNMFNFMNTNLPSLETETYSVTSPDNLKLYPTRSIEPETGSLLGAIQNDNFNGSQLTVTQNDRVIIMTTTDLLHLQIINMIPISTIINKLYPFITYSSILAISLFLFTLLLSSYIASTITRPFIKLHGLMQEVQQNNLDVSMNYYGRDEISILSSQFNRMVNRLDELIKENYQSKLVESHLRFLEKEAHLNALQQQINPHFLYNTLESISWIAYEHRVTEICDMTVALGKFFRGTIATGQDMILIQNEIELLNSYLYIQQIRYTFQVNMEISDEVQSCRIHKLMLQPLVENAIQHGIEPLEEGGLITIKGYLQNEMVHFEIIDNGKGMESEEIEHVWAVIRMSKDAPRATVGLRNVYERLSLHYPDNFIFTLHSTINEGSTVHFAYPYTR
ncbi:sensor histidine kinase [Paenibacillus sp. GCM10012307]|uniref:Histidine kinase n=1 Tax=Paenibacillus roseus TaxID=2798579 RepID=A0A934J3D1_9BACL|nr:histidine kinase [Paenibacillus roseus]MBJ6364021.1 histidine kinase [Paenibacillus roseus]